MDYQRDKTIISNLQEDVERGVINKSKLKDLENVDLKEALIKQKKAKNKQYNWVGISIFVLVGLSFYIGNTFYQVNKDFNKAMHETYTIHNNEKQESLTSLDDPKDIEISENLKKVEDFNNKESLKELDKKLDKVLEEQLKKEPIDSTIR